MKGKIMKYLVVIVLSAGLLISCSSEEVAPAAKAEMKMAKHSAGDGERLIYYTCPMESHKHVNSKEPGACPECNMEMVPGVVTSEAQMEYYGCPMKIHSHIRHEEAGRCEECKMELKPMRLKKSA